MRAGRSKVRAFGRASLQALVKDRTPDNQLVCTGIGQAVVEQTITTNRGRAGCPCNCSQFRSNCSSLCRPSTRSKLTDAQPIGESLAVGWLNLAESVVSRGARR